MKKEYSAQEIANEILKSVREMMQESPLYKSNNAHEVEAGDPPANDEAQEVMEEYAEVDSTEHEKKLKRKGDGFKDNDCLAGCGQGMSADDGDSESNEPPHEQHMDTDSNIEHDAMENYEDEQDDDIVEADEEDEAKKKDKEFLKTEYNTIICKNPSHNIEFPTSMNENFENINKSQKIASGSIVSQQIRNKYAKDHRKQNKDKVKNIDPKSPDASKYTEEINKKPKSSLYEKSEDKQSKPAEAPKPAQEPKKPEPIKTTNDPRFKEKWDRGAERHLENRRNQDIMVKKTNCKKSEEEMEKMWGATGAMAPNMMMSKEKNGKPPLKPDFPRPKGVEDLVGKEQNKEAYAKELKKKRMMKQQKNVNKCGEMKTIGKAEVPPHDIHDMGHEKVNEDRAQKENEPNSKAKKKIKPGFKSNKTLEGGNQPSGDPNYKFSKGKKPNNDKAQEANERLYRKSELDSSKLRDFLKKNRG